MVTDEEIKSFFNERKEQFKGKTVDQLREPIKNFLLNNKNKLFQFFQIPNQG